MGEASRRSRVGRWLLFAAVGYVGVLLVLLSLERKLIFRGASAEEYWQEPPDSRIQDVWLQSSTGDRIHAWWLPKENATDVVLYSHGNAGNLSGRGKGLTFWADRFDASVLIYDYPGYGKSGGKPSEAGCYAAAEAAFAWLTTDPMVAPENILLVGVSLGGSMAVELATRHPHRALVLAKAFTSIPDMAQNQYPWLPARFLVRTRFDNLAKIAECRRPLFMLHDTNDALVPVEQAERLFAAHPGPKEFMTGQGDHHSPLPPELFPRLRRFLDEQTKSP